MNKKMLDFIAWRGEYEFDTRKVLNLLKVNPVQFFNWDVRSVIINERHLVLRVFATRFKGYVIITMAANQTYTAEYLTSHGNLRWTQNNLTDESIAHNIDQRIEWLPLNVDSVSETQLDVTEDFEN